MSNVNFPHDDECEILFCEDHIDFSLKLFAVGLDDESVAYLIFEQHYLPESIELRVVCLQDIDSDSQAVRVAIEHFDGMAVAAKRRKLLSYDEFIGSKDTQKKI